MTTPDPSPSGSSEAQRRARDEFDRQRRLVDQLTTMHSRLRDRYHLQGTVVTCLILVASVIASAFAFAGGGTQVSIASISAERSTWLGWFAVAVFSLTLIDLVVDRRKSARTHSDAVRQLAALKSEYRRPLPIGEEIVEGKTTSERYQAIMDALPAIPDRQFNRLKAKHLTKVAVSKYLSDYPGMTYRQATRTIRSRSRASRG